MKSRRLRQGLSPPWSQTQPRCTGAFGVASVVVQLWPPSKVAAIYKCQIPLKLASCMAPAVGVPRNAKAALLGSPETTDEKTVFWIPKGTPTSTIFEPPAKATQVRPLSCDTATLGWPSP